MEPVVVSVTVERDGFGRLEVAWELVGSGPVEVAVGPTPTSIDHAAPVAVVDGSNTVLHGLGRGRHFVSVAPAGGGAGVVAAERLVPLEGTSNFRDLGGYRVGDGGRTRWGCVYRADALHALTVEDVAAIGRLGLRVVYDLRGYHERSSAPNVDLDGVRSFSLPIGGDAGRSGSIIDRILAGELDGFDDAFLAEVYVKMAENDAATFASVLTGLTHPGALPAVFHCTAGKDRTGMTAALLLSLLGVDEDVVLDDYALSTVHWSERRLAEMRPRFAARGIDIARFHSLFMAPRVAMEAAIAGLHERHGTVERYLVEAGGMASEVAEELRARLVQPA